MLSSMARAQEPVEEYLRQERALVTAGRLSVASAATPARHSPRSALPPRPPLLLVPGKRAPLRL